MLETACLLLKLRQKKENEADIHNPYYNDFLKINYFEIDRIFIH